MNEIDRAIRILESIRRKLKRRRIKVLQARIALCELVEASKYRGMQQQDEI